jgi:hypothetical protein
LHRPFSRSQRRDDLLRVKGVPNLLGENAPVAIRGVYPSFTPPMLFDA